jgi:inorganic pyrophosphatase
VPSRVIGVIRMVDDGEKDEKLICVPADSPQLAGIKDQADVPPHLLEEITYFFEHYKDLQKKKVTIEGVDDRAAAIKVVEEAIELYKKQ